MSIEEFSDQFDTSLNSHSTQYSLGDQIPHADITLDEYEKSLFLTQAQDEIVINLYNGKNSYGESFESSEEMRRYLDSLVKTKKYTSEDIIRYTEESIEQDEEPIEKPIKVLPVNSNSIFFKLPEDIAFITYEQVTFADKSLGCYDGEVADVYPVTQDEYNRIIKNPFRGPTKYRVLRMDTGAFEEVDYTKDIQQPTMVELVSKFNIGQYLIKYLAKPSPIILVDLQDTPLKIKGRNEQTPCKLNDIFHKIILERAVQLALISKSVNNNKGKGE